MQWAILQAQQAKTSQRSPLITNIMEIVLGMQANKGFLPTVSLQLAYPWRSKLQPSFTSDGVSDQAAGRRPATLCPHFHKTRCRCARHHVVRPLPLIDDTKQPHNLYLAALCFSCTLCAGHNPTGANRCMPQPMVGWWPPQHYRRLKLCMACTTEYAHNIQPLEAGAKPITPPPPHTHKGQRKLLAGVHGASPCNITSCPGSQSTVVENPKVPTMSLV